MEMKRKMKDVRFDDDCRIGLDVIVKKRKAGVWQPTQIAAWAFTGHGIALLCCKIVLTNNSLSDWAGWSWNCHLRLPSRSGRSAIHNSVSNPLGGFPRRPGCI